MILNSLSPASTAAFCGASGLYRRGLGQQARRATSGSGDRETLLMIGPMWLRGDKLDRCLNCQGWTSDDGNS